MFKPYDSWMGMQSIGQLIQEQDNRRLAISLNVNNKLLTAMLDIWASNSFVSYWVKGFLPTIKGSISDQVNGAVQNTSYNIEGHTTLKAKCSNLDIGIPVAVMTSLMTDIMLGHDFHEKYGAMLDCTSHMIFMSKDNHLEIAWYNGNVEKSHSFSGSNKISFASSSIWSLIQILLILFEFAVCMIQSYVFTVLSTLYSSEVM